MYEVPRYALIACDVFIEELEALGGSEPPWQSIHTLEMGLHDQPDILRAQVQRKIYEVEQDTTLDYIVLAYGLCGNGLLGIRAGRLPLVFPQAHDCLSVLLGSREKHSAILKKNPRTYFYSPGWIRERRAPGSERDKYLREKYAEQYGDDEEMIEDLIEADRDMFSHFNCALYVDITQNEKAEHYCRGCAKSMDWEFQKVEGDPSFLKDLLWGECKDARFVWIQPGQQIATDSDSMLKAIPVS